MNNPQDIVSRRPFLNWGFSFEIGKSNETEDAFVMEYFDKKPTDRKRVVVDIGAADGLTGSNSRRLITEKAWQGVLVEPFMPFYRYLLELYENNENVEILNYACDIEEGNTLIYYRDIQEAVGLTSLVVKWENSQQIETRLFNNIIKQKEIDFLSLDTEGKDLDILRSIDFSKYKIEIICVERSQHQDYNSSVFDFLNAKGYKHSHTTGHNFLFVKQ